MKLFHSITLTWWQTGIFKVSVFALGITIGAYWSDFFVGYLVPLLVIAAITGVYVAYLYMKQ